MGEVKQQHNAAALHVVSAPSVALPAVVAADIDAVVHSAVVVLADAAVVVWHVEFVLAVGIERVPQQIEDSEDQCQLGDAD